MKKILRNLLLVAGVASTTIIADASTKDLAATTETVITIQEAIERIEVGQPAVVTKAIKFGTIEQMSGRSSRALIALAEKMKQEELKKNSATLGDIAKMAEFAYIPSLVLGHPVAITAATFGASTLSHGNDKTFWQILFGFGTHVFHLPVIYAVYKIPKAINAWRICNAKVKEYEALVVALEGLAK